MSKALVFSDALDNTNIEIRGIKATMMTQTEVMSRASASIQAPLKKTEREFLSHNITLPLPVPVVPLDIYSSGKSKPKTVMHQLNDNHLGTTQFRTVCTTCGLGSGSCCGKSAVHVLPLPVSPVSHAPILLTLCKATCFACARFLSEEYEQQLPCDPIMDYNDCVEAVHTHGKYEGGRISMAGADEAAARWSKFKEVSVVANRRLLKLAASKGLSAIECQYCGALQPNDIAMHQKVIATSWNVSQTYTSHDGTISEGIWKPGDLFWQTVLQTLGASQTMDCDCASAEEEVGGPSTIDGLQWIGKRLLGVMMKQSQHQTVQEQWLMLVLPFIFGGQILQNTLSKYWGYADIQKRLAKMRHEDIWRVGKSPTYSHPKDFAWVNLYVADKVMRPVVQETSGGMIRANDPRTESLEQIIKLSAKLRLLVTQQSKDALESWMTLCKFQNMDTFLERCFSNTTDIFYLHEYAGDARLGLSPNNMDVAKKYSNLQHEISSVFDHTVDTASASKNYNSAATGVRNAKNQVRMNHKVSSAAALATSMDVDDPAETPSLPEAPVAKKKSVPRRSKAVLDADTGALHQPHRAVSLNIDRMPCPCQLLNGAPEDDDSLKSYNIEGGRYGLCQSLQASLWSRAIAQVCALWNHLVVDHDSMPAKFFAPEALQVSCVAHTREDGSILYPSTDDELKTILHACGTTHVALANEVTQLLHHCARDGLERREAPSTTLFAPKLPSPEQFKTAKFRSGSKQGSAAAKKQSGNLKKHLDGKENLVRFNVITKRVNFSARFVLVPCGTLAPDQVGLPYRFCLGQTHPILVTEANQWQLQVCLAKARYWSFMGLLPDLGGIDSVITSEGIQIPINNVVVPGETFFDDDVFILAQERKVGLLKAFASEQDLVEQWGAPLHVGWTCNVHLKDGDIVIISRPPALHRYNHCAMSVVARPGFVMYMLTSPMHAYGADADGDALMVTIMQSTQAKASIRFLMSLANNMICPRRHATLCALQQDALMGAALLISESDRFQLNKREATKLASCFRLVDHRRYSRVGFKGRGPEWGDPKTKFGPLWKLAVPESGQAIRMPPPYGVTRDGKPYWKGLQFIESSFPSDFCYYKRMSGCPWSIMRVISFLTKLASCETALEQQRLIKTDPDFPHETLVVIWKGKWICGEANGATLSTSSDSIIEALWRHYGKHFACDWMGDVCFLAQTYVSDIRAVSCSIGDMILGGRSNFSSALLPKHDTGDNDDDSISDSAWPGPDGQVSRLSYLKHMETQRVSAMAEIEKTFAMANAYLDSEASRISHADVALANAKLAEYASIMLMYGGNMFAAHNKSYRNNISLMAKTGSKGNSSNTAMMSVTLGVAKIKGNRSVGYDIQANTRNHFGDHYGERTAATLGFINRGFIHGLTGYQFFQTSREARNRIKNSSDPSTTGYLQTKIGVNSQSVSVRMDGTVRNQQHEIIQLNYGGDGYDACKITRVRLENAMFMAALGQTHERAKFQTHSALSLVLGKMAKRPENDFASADTLVAKGFSVLLNVDVPGLFLLHSGQWTPSKRPKCTDDMLANQFEQFCTAILQYDPTQSLLPFDLFLAVRLYMTPDVFGPMRWCSIQELERLLGDLYRTYCENMADPGEAVGPLACQSSNQPMTQLIMKSFKTDVGSGKEALQLGSDVSRITELFGFTDPKAAIASIVLSPEWVKTRVQAEYVASQFVGTLLSDWVIENGQSAEWINLDDAVSGRGGVGLMQAATQIVVDYETNRCSKMPAFHEICTWQVESNFLILPAVSQYVALFVDDTIDILDERILLLALEFVQQSWKACLTSCQMGGLMIEPCQDSEANPAGLTLKLWMAFRHGEKDLATGLFDCDLQSARAVEAWMNQMNNLVVDLTFSLYIAGHPEVESCMAFDEPAKRPNEAEIAALTDDNTCLPDIAHCYRLRFRSKRLAPFLWHPCVVDQLCYTSNLKEMRDVYGIEATSQMLSFEASRVLSSEVDVYVQPRHLQLLGDIMTSEGDVLSMTQHGLKKRKKTSYLAAMSFEDVAANLIKGGLNAKYDAFDHIVANIMFAQRDTYIGSGSCRVVASHLSFDHKDDGATQANGIHSYSDSLAPPPPPDFETVAIAPSACDLYNLVDFVVGSSFAAQRETSVQ